MKDEMDLFELIEAAHRKVETIFSEIEKTKGSKKLDQYFNQLYKELNVHAQTEELTLYPAMRDHDDIKELVNEAEQEHTEVKVLLEQMKSLDATSSEFKEKISTLKEAVQHHVEEEENEVFPKVRQSMSDEELKQLAKEFEETQSKLQQDLSVATR
jgi:hemerythrin superfamily protein